MANRNKNRRIIMIRDMELLLNTIYDDEIKSYLREALNCYSAEAYRACVIMSIIGGIHDLHNKLKILAPSNHDIADLEKKVSDSKEKLNPYERLLVDGCARSDIDLLTPSEAKEINRCFDIRNDCAHPSDYNCTAETARYVYSTIIDILASKPILLGQQYITTIYNNIISDTFFPRIDKTEIQSFVNKQLQSCSKRIIAPLAQKIVKGIMEESSHTNNNKLFFLANMSTELNNNFDRIIQPLLLDSKFHSSIMIMLSSNVNIINVLSDENIKRILHIFKSYVKEDQNYNQTIIDVLQNTKLSDASYNNNIVELLNFSYDKMTDNQIDLWIKIVTNNTYNQQRLSQIKSDYISHILDKTTFSSQRFQEIFILCNNKDLFSSLIKNISKKVADYDYTISNPAVLQLKELNENFITSLSIKDVNNIIYSILAGNQGYGREVAALLDSIYDKPFYKRYINETVPSFNYDELLEMKNYNLTDYTLYKFITIITQNTPDFDNHFISLAKDYISNNFDDYYATILPNTINKLENSDSKS